MFAINTVTNCWYGLYCCSASAIHMKCDRVLRIMFAPKRKREKKVFLVCTHHQLWY